MISYRVSFIWRFIMKNYFAAVLLLLLSVSCISLSEGKNSGVVNHPLRVAVPADGSSNVCGSFITLAANWANPQTEVFVKAEKNNLYLEFRCYGKVENTVFSAKKPDDDMTLFGGEHIEFQLAPDGGKGRRYYHFAINPAGSLYHAEGQDIAWNPGKFKYKITDSKDFRCYSIELPWQIFGLDSIPSSGTVWKANFCRGAKMKNSNIEFSSWSGAASYHELMQMGKLFFGAETAPSIRFFDNKIALNGIENNNNQYLFQLVRNNQMLVEDNLNGAKDIDFSAKLPKRYVPLKNIDQISLKLISNNCVVWEKIAFENNKAKDFMSLDKFEYLKDSAMKCSFAEIPGKLIVKNDSKVFIQQEISANPAFISLENLPAGRYVAEYKVDDRYSERVFFITEKFPVAGVMAKTVKLTAKNENLMLDGEPFFLLGISGGSKTYFPYSPGFTLQYGKGAVKNAFTYQVFPVKKFVRKPAVGYAFYHDWQQKAENYLNRQRKATTNYWRTLAYEANLKVFRTQKDGTLKYEPEGHKIYGQLYKMAKTFMPDSLFSIHADNMTVLPDYAEFCDIMEFSSWRSSYHYLNMLFYLGEDFDFVRKNIGSKPIVMWLGGSIPNSKVRSAEEIRAGVYYTVIKGGAGNIIHMGHGGIPAHRTRFWSMLSMLQNEINSFYAELQKGIPYNIELPSGFAGRAVITADNELLLVLLNKCAFSQTLELDYPYYQKEKIQFTPFEPRVIRLAKCR